MAESLHIAAQRGDLATVEVMVNRGVAVDARWGEKRITSLIVASCSGKNNVAAYLLRHKADPNARDDRDMTALMWAAFCGHMKVVTTLLAAGARVREADGGGTTALHWAAMEGHLPIVTALLAYKANPWAQNATRCTAGDEARWFGNPDVAAVLEEAMRVPSLMQACSKVILHATPPSRLQELPLLPILKRNLEGTIGNNIIIKLVSLPYRYPRPGDSQEHNLSKSY